MREMKNSGIDWIGLIPKDWSICKVKNIFFRKNEKANNEEPVVLSLARSGVKVRDITNGEGQLAENYSNYNPVAVDDLLLNPMDLYSGANCSVSKVEGVISPAYINLKAMGSNNSTYYDYYFKTQYWSMALFAHGKGVSFDNRWTLNTETLMNYYLPRPTIEEQNRIAIFLNEKVREIDNAIVKTKETIEDYKKLKQFLITNTIRNGLNENEELKESKIDWIGKINSKYEIARLKNVAKINGRIGFRGYTQSDIVSEGEGAITISPSNFSNMKMNYSKCQYISWDKYYESPEIQLKNGDILFVKTGSTYGKTCLVQDLPLEATINPQSIIIKPQSINDRYLTYYLNSNLTTYQVEISVVGGTIPTISQEKINNYLIILPPSEEQIVIVEYLDKKCRKFDNLIESKERIVEELEQYKKSVIYEYVTGKKEVK